MLVTMISIVLVVNSISSSCGSSKILTWTGKYKSGVGASAGKYKLRSRTGKYKLGARAGKYKLGAGAGAGGQTKGRGPGNTKTPSKTLIAETLKSPICQKTHFNGKEKFTFQALIENLQWLCRKWEFSYCY